MLWIGYLQWHFRTRGSGLPPSPILRDFHNIECRDAVLACDARRNRPRRARPAGHPLGRPNDQAPSRHRRTRARRDRPRAAAALCQSAPGRMAAGRLHRRQSAVHRRTGACAPALGDGYVEALRADLAGCSRIGRLGDVLVASCRRNSSRAGQAQRFGLITTNSLKQTFNRRVVASTHLSAKEPSHCLRRARSPLGRQRRRRRRAHRDDRRQRLAKAGVAGT